MKNLLKISCVFAIVLFLSMSVKAQGTQTGTITTTVASYLQFGTFTPSFALNYDGAPGATVQYGSASTLIPVKSSHGWQLQIWADGNLIKTGAPGVFLPIASVAVTGAMSGNLGATAANKLFVNGALNEDKTIIFTLQNLGNEWAGEYTAAITYALVSM